MIWIRRIRPVAAAVVVALSAAACGIGGSDRAPGELTMTVWTADQAQLAALDELTAEFAESHEGTSIEIQSIPQDDYLTKLSVRLSGSNAPDVGWLGAPDAVGLTAAGRLADLTAALESDPGYALDDFVPAAFTNWRDDGRIHGVPFSTSPFFTIYNKDLLAAAGLPDPAALAARGEWTWERLAAMARTLQPRLPPGSYAFQSNEGAVYGPLVWTTLDPLLRSFGGAVHDPATGECRLDDAESVAAVDLYHRMVFADGTAVPPGSEADFFAGDAAFTLTQLSRLGQLEGGDFAWGVTALPAGPGGPVAVTGQSGFVAFEDSPNRDLAVELVKFLSTRSSAERLAQFYPPARNSVLDEAGTVYADSVLPAQAVQDVLVPGIREGEPFPYPAIWRQVRGIAEPVFDRLWTPDAEVPAVLGDICEQITPLLEPPAG
jgi:multiple sugar transport system substrate-binding protein